MVPTPFVKAVQALLSLFVANPEALRSSRAARRLFAVVMGVFYWTVGAMAGWIVGIFAVLGLPEAHKGVGLIVGIAIPTLLAGLRGTWLAVRLWREA